MKSLALSSSLFLLFAFAPTTAFLQQKEQKALLRVKLVAHDDSPVRLAKVLLRSESRKDLSLKERKEGVYEIDAPAGDYYLVVTKKNFCPEIRGMFEIKPAASTFLSIAVQQCFKSDKMIHPGGDTEILSSSYDVPFKEDFIQVNRSRFKVQVKYGERNVGGSRVSYHAVRTGNTLGGVTLSYNLTSVRSSSLVFFTDDNSLIASGQVTLNDGETTEKFEKVCLRIEGISVRTIDCGSLNNRN